MYKLDQYVFADASEIWYEGKEIRAVVEQVLPTAKGYRYMVRAMDLSGFNSTMWLDEKFLRKVGPRDRLPVEINIGNAALAAAKLDDPTRSPLFNENVKKLYDQRTNRYRVPFYIAMEVLCVLETSEAYLGRAGGFGGEPEETHVIRTAAKNLRKKLEAIVQ